MRDTPRYQEIGSSRKHQQPEPKPATFIIEIEGKQCHVDDACQRMSPQRHIQHQETEEEEKEQPAAEQDRRVRLVRQELSQFLPRELMLIQPVYE